MPPQRKRDLVFQGPMEDAPAPQSELEDALDTADQQEPDPPEEFPPETFLLICDAPKDGTLLQVKMDPDDPDEAAVYAVWRSTMMREKGVAHWVRVGFWADPVTKRQLGGDPIVYRMANATPILGVMVG